MSKAQRVGAVVWALVSACGGGDQPAGLVGGTAVYIVPPRTSASVYAVTDVSWRVVGGVARLDYTLPRLLVGMSSRVSLQGPASEGAMALTGPAGTATCSLRPSAGISLRCEERFPGIAVDLEGVRREAQRADAANIQARVDVASRFSIEPIGVLEVSSP